MLYGEHAFLDRFDAAAADGFRGVEFVSPYEFTPEQVQKAAASAGLEVVLFNSPAGDWTAGQRGCACDPRAQETFQQSVRQALDYAGALGTKRLHVMAGILPEDAGAAEAEAVLVENLRWAAQHLQGAGVTALIEPINPVDMPGYGLSSLAQGERVLAAVGHDNLMLQYDFYHMAMMGAAWISEFTRLLPLIGHVQIADQPGRGEPGTGTIDFVDVFAAIRGSGYEGWVGAEYLPKRGTSAGLGWRDLI